jgi:tetratricopeptide (TPR) repeat protein
MSEEANAMIMLGNAEEAVKFIEEREIYVKEYHYNYIAKRSIIYHRAGFYEKSNQDLEYIDSTGIFKGAYNSMFAKNYFLLEKFSEAEEYFSKVISDGLDADFWTYKYRAECRIELGRFKEAIEDLEIAKKMNTNDGEIDFLIGKSYHFLGNLAYAGLNMASSYQKGYEQAESWMREMGNLN